MANRLVGTLVLVGMTYEKPDGTRLEQFYGRVVAAKEGQGVTLHLEGSRSGETFRLPWHLGAFFPAKPGSYRLKDTGEVVEDPDYTTTWTVKSPSN